MAILQNSAESLRLLIPTAQIFEPRKFIRDISAIRPSHVDHVVKAIYEDMEAINSSLGAAVHFTDLIDTPNNYTGKADWIVGVNSAGTGLEYKEWVINNSSNEMYPATAGTGLGKSGNGIGKILFDSSGNLDYDADLEILSSGTQVAVFKQTTGYLGLGVSNPLESLHTSGGIKIGAAVQSTAGTIRWTGSDFEGHNGTTWLSMTTGQNLSTLNLTWFLDRTHDLNGHTNTMTNGTWTNSSNTTTNLEGVINMPNLGVDNTLTKLVVEGTAGILKYRDLASIFGSISTSVIWVDNVNGNDTTGNGSIYNPYKTILKAITVCAANGFIYVMPGTYQEIPLDTSVTAISNNITINALPGAKIKGPDRTNPTYNTSFNGDKKFIYRINTAITFNIVGSFDVTGDMGLISTDNTSAIVNIEVNTYKLTGVFGAMNLRFRNGTSRFIVKTGDLEMRDQQGLFIGPGNGSVYLNVLGGKIKMFKTNLTYVSNQTRVIQYRSTGNSYIECSGIETVVDGDHSYTEHLDPVFADGTGKVTINTRGGFIKDTNFVNDGDYNKYAGQEGCLIASNGGNILFYGNIYSWYTNGVWTDGSTLSKVEVHGNIRVDNSSCIRANNSNSGSIINVVGDLSTGPTAPANKERGTIHHLNSNRVFVRGTINKFNSGENMPTILYTGANLTLDSGTKLINNTTGAITTEVSSRVVKLQDIIRMNQDLSATPVAKVIKFTINKIRDSKIYSITINGTAYTYTSGVSATNLTIATGLTAAIGTPSGVASVVNNGDGTITITATAGTNLTVVDSTAWATNYKWEIIRSALDDNWRITINGTAFTFISSDTTYYHETNGGVTDIRDNVKTLIQANAGINALIGTYQVDKFGLTLITNSTSVFDTIVGSGNSFGFVPIQHKAILVTTLEIGYLGGLINKISGTSFEYDPDIEAPTLLND